LLDQYTKQGQEESSGATHGRTWNRRGAFIGFTPARNLHNRAAASLLSFGEKLQEEEDWINILHITEEDMTKEKILGSIKHN